MHFQTAAMQKLVQIELVESLGVMTVITHWGTSALLANQQARLLASQPSNNRDGDPFSGNYDSFALFTINCHGRAVSTLLEVTSTMDWLLPSNSARLGADIGSRDQPRTYRCSLCTPELFVASSAECHQVHYETFANIDFFTESPYFGLVPTQEIEDAWGGILQSAYIKSCYF
jgi:hypothetical protein